jgi:two-component system CheB/CheR fusion protein
MNTRQVSRPEGIEMKTSRSQSRKAVRAGRVRGPTGAANSEAFSIVAIVASTGCLEACKKSLDALPPDNAIAFLIVQHLEPSRDNLLGERLGARTSMGVVQATEDMDIQRARPYHPAWPLPFGR